MNGLVKTLKIDDNNSIKLVGNAYTFIIYKNYFGRDLLNDIISFASKNANDNVVDKVTKHNISGLEDFNSLEDNSKAEILSSLTSYQFDSEFILNFMASLMATARYPEKIDVIDLILEIPPHFVSDQQIISELMQFLSLFIKQKKR